MPRSTSGDSSLTWLGHYRAGLPHGTCWTSVLGGGWVVGRVDSTGSYTGLDIAFLYPDLSTALVGEWRDGELVSGLAARLSDVQAVQGVLVPSFTVTDTREYRRWVSTSDRLLSPPHLTDPYESGTVCVGQSGVEGGGEGLYAGRDIAANTLVAYYNGVRMTKEQQSPYGDTGYAIFVEWKERGRRTGEHMDLPPEVSQVSPPPSPSSPSCTPPPTTPPPSHTNSTTASSPTASGLTPSTRATASSRPSPPRRT